MLERHFEVLVVSLLDAKTVVGQPNVRVVVTTLILLQLRSFLIVNDRLIEILHNKSYSSDQLMHSRVARRGTLPSFK